MRYDLRFLFNLNLELMRLSFGIFIRFLVLSTYESLTVNWVNISGMKTKDSNNHYWLLIVMPIKVVLNTYIGGVDLVTLILDHSPHYC